MNREEHLQRREYNKYRRSLYNTMDWLENVKEACKEYKTRSKKEKEDKQTPPKKKYRVDSLSLCPSYIAWKEEQKRKRKLKKAKKNVR